MELFERDVPVYMLYDDNSEGMAFEAEDIVLFSGCFGISREDWDAIKGEVPPMDMELIRKKREQAFLCKVFCMRPTDPHHLAHYH